jgi:hypothetical protein
MSTQGLSLIESNLTRLPVCRPRRACSCKASRREPKNPKHFTNMDEAREYLHRREQNGPSMAGLLNFISQSAFGQQLEQVGTSTALTAKPGKGSSRFKDKRWWKTCTHTTVTC